MPILEQLELNTTQPSTEAGWMEENPKEWTTKRVIIKNIDWIQAQKWGDKVGMRIMFNNMKQWVFTTEAIHFTK